jgi:monoamine oxidase
VDWPNSPTNRLAANEKEISPAGLLWHYVLAGDPLVGLDDWRKPEFEPIDRKSLRQYLAERGASPEALRLMDVGIPAWNLDDANALDFLRKNHYYSWEARNGPYSVVSNGMSTLTDAMAASLNAPVQLNKVVRAMEVSAHSVTVTCQDHSSYQADACINTIPPTVLKDIPLVGPVPAGQRQAWRELRSDQSIQVCFQFTEPFWDKDGLPPNMWTDGPFEFFAHTPSRTDPNGVLRAYINGRAVEPLNKLSANELGARAVAELVRLRPAAAGIVNVSHIHNWSTYPFSRGHIAYYAPGGIARYADLMGMPAGAMFFAGEHNSRVTAGIEGACEAAEYASIAVLEKLGRA